ncbi:MAG: DNA-3-methyladenine glycosylase, partial [Chlamydiales bacterium]
MNFKPLPPAFYQRDDVVQIARELLGKWIFTKKGNEITGGMIIETEAYGGVSDRACHAYNGRRTPRTEVLYKAGGVAYVYLCYGMHNLLNFITNVEGEPEGVLIRAIKPTHGIEIMQVRRKGKTPLISGPGTVTQALGITRAYYGLSLSSSKIWVEDRAIKIPAKKIEITPRIGVD